MEEFNYRRFVAQQPKESIGEQLQELVTNDMMGAMYHNLKLLATVCLTMPVTTASVERSLSKMKLIKSHLRNRLSERSLSHLMKVALEAPEQLSDNDLEQIVNIWNRKCRKISV